VEASVRGRQTIGPRPEGRGDELAEGRAFGIALDRDECSRPVVVVCSGEGTDRMDRRDRNPAPAEGLERLAPDGAGEMDDEAAVDPPGQSFGRRSDRVVRNGEDGEVALEALDAVQRVDGLGARDPRPRRVSGEDPGQAPAGSGPGTGKRSARAAGTDQAEAFAPNEARIHAASVCRFRVGPGA